MSFNFKGLLLTLSMMLTLSGCGDLLGTKVVKRQLGGSQFEVQCELDMNKFSQIMTENIGPQIRCLGENLNLFIRVVKSAKPGYLSRTQLVSYLADFRPDVKPEVVRALGAVFSIGHLITGEDPNYISKETIDKVINFAIIFNKESALNFKPVFQNETPVSYWLHLKHRENISKANKAIIQALRDIFNPNRGGAVHKINIVELLKSFSTEQNRHELEKVEKLLFGKKVLLGGDKEYITHSELERLILNFDHLLLIGLDAIRYKYILLNQESILQLLKRDVNDLYDIITQGSLNDHDGESRDNEVLFTVNEAIEAAKLFIDESKFNIENYRNLIVEVKKIIMSGNSEVVTGLDLKNLFKHGKNLLQTGTVFHRIYEKFKIPLSSSQPVDIDFSDYRHTYPEHQKELDQFERIVKKYRFMKGEFVSGFYFRGYKRNPDAVFEIALFEYVLRLLFINYGSPSPNFDAVGGYSIDKMQMQALVKKFENELIDLELLLPQGAIRTADNISLLGSLFQFQSDKNKVMDVNEAAEFGISLFTSINIAEDLYSYMEEKNCPMETFPEADKPYPPRVEPGCVRANFWKGLCTYYWKYYPLMFESMNVKSAAECKDWKNTPQSDIFLDRAIEAARTCNHYTDGQREEIHYSKGDFMTIMLALIHAETTILRWDINKNNIMDPDEVMRAYEIYSPALDGFLEGKSPIIKKFKKQIFQFMIKYEQVPDEKDKKSILKFVGFLLSFKHKAPATRKTIASILVAIGEQNDKKREGPQFNCNLLRKPYDIPREPEAEVKQPERNGYNYSYLLEPYLYLAD
jgi:hypothetical protein